MENGFSLISHILEILEIEVCNIIYSLEIRAAGGRAAAGGRLQGLCCAALDYFWNMFPGISVYPGNIGDMVFLYFGIFPKKARAEISRRMHRRMSRDLSYETDPGPKTKTYVHIIVILFSCCFHIYLTLFSHYLYIYFILFS